MKLILEINDTQDAKTGIKLLLSLLDEHQPDGTNGSAADADSDNQQSTASTESRKSKQPKADKKPKEDKKEPAAEKSLSIDEVRAKVSHLVNDHREAIKGQLTELGATSVTNLDEAKYPEFMEFLEGLSE